MEFQWPYQGTPAQFVIAVENLDSKDREMFGPALVGGTPVTWPPDPLQSPGGILFGLRVGGTIAALAQPGNRSLIMVNVPDEKWPLFSECWERLQVEMEEQRFKDIELWAAHGGPTFKLLQEFLFNSDAQDVCAYMLDGQIGANARQIEMAQGIWICRCYLSFFSAPEAPYTGVLTVYLWNKEEVNRWRPEAVWLVWDKQVARIVITQDRPGECKASLYIETDPQRWHFREGAPWKVPMITGGEFIGQFWKDLTQGWLAKQSAGSRPQDTQTLNALESKILAAYQALEKEGLPTTDENIAARLPLSPKGQSYTREWVNKVRNRMRDRKIKV